MANPTTPIPSPAQPTPDGGNHFAVPADSKLWLTVLNKDRPVQDAVDALREGANPNSRDGVAQTPLHIAAQYGNAEKIKVLLNAGAQLEARDALKETPLHWAARHGNEATLVALLDAGADTMAENFERRTPLTLMVKDGRGQGASAETRSRIAAELIKADDRQRDLKLQRLVAGDPSLEALAKPHPLLAIPGFARNTDGTWTDGRDSFETRYREEPSGTFYRADTPEGFIKHFEGALAAWSVTKDRPMVRVFYGDPESGLDQLETHRVCGFIARSPGPFKRPMLAHEKDGNGSALIVDHAVVRVQINGIDRWQTENYHQGFLALQPTGDPREPFGVFRNGANPARFAREEDREGWLRFIRGETHSIRQAPSAPRPPRGSDRESNR